MRAGRYCMRLSRFFMMAASWPGLLQGAEVAQAVLHVRPGAFHRIQLGCVTGSRATVSHCLCASVKVRIVALTWVFRLSQQRISGA